MLLDEAPRQLAGELANLVLRTWAVGIATGIADVDDVFRRKQIDDGPGNGQPTEPTVEHPDRSVHVATHIDGPGYVASTFYARFSTQRRRKAAC